MWLVPGFVQVVGAWKELVRRESEATPSSSQQAGAAAAAERPSQPGSQAAQPGAVAAPAKSEGARSEGGGGSQVRAGCRAALLLWAVQLRSYGS